ncbi:MAG: manganese efflux pump [Tidjanibacter sp.]|nr:manganese efflux pump [Tidjanibacter sp.]
MDFVTLFLIAVGLSMDAFSVAICKGLSMPRATAAKCSVVGLWFGGFQALMPIVGYFLGVGFRHTIESFDHWLAFGLLAIIGINMIRESMEKEEENNSCGCCSTNELSARKMFPMAVATSIDALAVGVSFAFLAVDIWTSALAIGVTTFVLSFVGVKVGNIFGAKYKSKAELAGGIILILIGLKILLEHTVFA